MPSRQHSSYMVSWSITLRLAFQSLGVIYGDIGTSPLYVFSSTFTDGIKHNDDILGVLSLIIYTLLLIPMIKYVFVVLLANDNGNGGTFALYSLICHHANVRLIPKDGESSSHRHDTSPPSNQLRIRAQVIKDKLETSMVAKIFLFLITIFGTSMVIGDGVLTPCISVLSAVGGISSLSQDGVVYISITILIVLFWAQRFGTDKVGYTFAPAITIWFLCIGVIGLYNLFKYEPSVLKANNPKYVVDYFYRDGTKAWSSLGGVVLCFTGTEAMFADLGHFNVPAVQLSFISLVFPSVLLSYIGQAAYLTKFPSRVDKSFYASIPTPIYWPTFVLANVAAVIASQAMISGAFAIISQSLSLGCFPRVKIVRTSTKYVGQVYIPEVNYLLMIACVIVTLKFRTTDNLCGAYGIAVVAVMLITTCMVTLIMLVTWDAKMLWISLFFAVYVFVEILFFSAVACKFVKGGYLPLVLAMLLVMVMGTWHYALRERRAFELENEVPSSYMSDLSRDRGISRIPGVGLFLDCSELAVRGTVPSTFPRFVSNSRSAHSLVVFLSIENVRVCRVGRGERFSFRRAGPRECRAFHCTVRRSYGDAVQVAEEIERELFEDLKEFIRQEYVFLEISADNSREEEEEDDDEERDVDGESSGISVARSDPSLRDQADSITSPVEQTGPAESAEIVVEALETSGSTRSFDAGSSNGRGGADQLRGVVEAEIEFVRDAMEQGVYYLLGETELVARSDSSFLKKVVINCGYAFLRNNFRGGETMFPIPKKRLLRIGVELEI